MGLRASNMILSQFSSRQTAPTMLRAMLRAMLRVLMLLAVLVAVLASVCVRALAQGAPFPAPNGRFYQIRQTPSTTSSQLYVLNRYNLGSGGTAIGASSAVVLNVLGLNPLDNYFYTLRVLSGNRNELYRIGQSGPVLVGTIADLPSGTDFNSGTFDGAGNYYVTNGGGTLYRVTGTAGATNVGGVATGVSATAIPLSPVPNLGDIAYDPATGQIFGLSFTLDPPQLAVINPTTGAVSISTVSYVGAPAGTSIIFGTLFFDTSDRLYAYANGGAFFTFAKPTTPGAAVNATYLAGGPSTNQSDGASNPFARVPLQVDKSVAALVRPNATTFDITFDVTLQNLSSTDGATNAQITENLSRTFALGTPTITVSGAPAIIAGTALATNAGFNGTTNTRLLAGSSTLGAGQSATVRFTTRLVYPSAASVPQSASNIVYASSTSTVDPAINGNPGFTFPNGNPLPPADVIGTDDSSPTPISLLTISGHVFEDVNYGGGAGRPFGTAGTVGVPAGTRVELYSVSGTTATFSTATTTDATGQYQFGNVPPGSYLVRVVNGGLNGVKSTRPTTGQAGTPLAVQTFRVNSGAADPNRVGGNNPDATSAPDGAPGTTINTTTGAIEGNGAPAGSVAQSTGLVAINTASADGMDLGFNFSTIVNTASEGQGSLRQFIVNSNVLANGGLAQVGQTAGQEHSIFMIASSRLSAGVARIGITDTALPAITDALTAIDGATQTANIGDTNGATLGTSPNVGISQTNVPSLNGPEVEIYDADAPNGAGRSVGLTVSASDTTIRRIAIYGFGNATNSDLQGNIFIGNVLRTLIELNAIGTTATSFSDPAGAPGGRSGGDNVRTRSGDSGTVRLNVIGWSNGKGIALEGATNGSDGAQSWTVRFNEVRSNALTNPSVDGIDVEHSGAATIQFNLFAANGGVGIDGNGGLGGNTIDNNTSTSNGFGAGANVETAGVRVFGNGSTLSNNIISGNAGAGVMVVPAAQNNVITRNSIFNNGSRPATGGTAQQIGIDLLEAGQNAKTGTDVAGRGFVTPNDSGDGDSGANALLNFPVLESARLNTITNEVVLRGFARAGSTVEIFVAAPDPSGFGEGQTYFVTRVEGSAQDADGTTSTYNGATASQPFDPALPNVGSDTTNRFEFRLPASSAPLNTLLTTTATVAGTGTSEFSNNIRVAQVGPQLAGRVYLDANASAVRDNAENTTNESGLFVKAFLLDSSGNPAATAAEAATVDAATGQYTFATLSAGRYRLALDDNATLSDAAPANVGARGYVGTEAPLGVRDDVALASGAQAAAQDFGLFRGSSISGVVFNDNGLGMGGVAADGLKQAGEVGLPGVTVRALGAGVQVLASAQTSAQGAYTLFVPSGSGPARIAETNPSGFLSTGASLGNSGGTYDRAADSIAFTPVAGTIYSALSFGDVRAPTLENSSSLSISPGGSVLLPHVFRAFKPGTVSFTASGAPSPAGLAFTRVLYRDLNCNGVLDGAEGNAPISTLAITKADLDASGGQFDVCLLIKEFAPANAPLGSQDKISLGASFDFAENGVAPLANAVLTRSDTVVVKLTGDLVLSKTVDKPTAGPGENVVYRITFRNQGSQPLQSLVVQDVVPAFTTFVSQSAGPLPTGLSGPTFARSGTNGSALQWTFGGALAPNATGYVEFTVRINQ